MHVVVLQRARFRNVTIVADGQPPRWIRFARDCRCDGSPRCHALVDADNNGGNVGAFQGKRQVQHSSIHRHHDGRLARNARDVFEQLLLLSWELYVLAVAALTLHGVAFWATTRILPPLDTIHCPRIGCQTQR